MNHAELQTEVVERCHELRLHVHHCRMIESQAGFPDLVIIGVGGVLWRELKVPPDQLSGIQSALGYTLKAAAQDWAVWTPDDWWSGLIIDELVEAARAPIYSFGEERS